MPTDKRERQRAGREARREAAMAAQRQAARRRQVVGAVALVALVAAIGLFLSRGGGDDSSVAAGKDDEGTATTVAPGATTVPAASPGTGECPPAEGTPEPHNQFDAAPPMCIDPARSYTAEIETDLGSFTVALDASRAPKTVNNFVFLARNRYYDGVPFHRVIPGFVVQGGDGEKGDGTGGPGYSFADELPPAGSYEVGSLAMANSGPDTNGSQFFVVTGPQGVQLPPSYSLFGKVESGLDVVKAIEADGSASGDPEKTHRIAKVTVTEKG